MKFYRYEDNSHLNIFYGQKGKIRKLKLESIYFHGTISYQIIKLYATPRQFGAADINFLNDSKVVSRDVKRELIAIIFTPKNKTEFEIG